MSRGPQSKKRLEEHRSYQLETSGRVFFAVPRPELRLLQVLDVAGKVLYPTRTLEQAKRRIERTVGPVISCKVIESKGG